MKSVTVDQASIRILYREVAEIESNLDYIARELPSLSVPHETKLEVSEWTRRLGSVVHDINKEISDLADTLRMHSSEKSFDLGTANHNPEVRMDYIRDGLKNELPELNSTVQRLKSLAGKDLQTYGLVFLLVSESATNILQSCEAIFGALDTIHLTLLNASLRSICVAEPFQP